MAINSQQSNEGDPETRAWVPLLPSATGLRTTVWIGLRETLDERPFVLCSRSHGERTKPDDAAVVLVWPEQAIEPNMLDEDDVRYITAWVTLNQQAVRDYWIGKIDPIGMMQALRKIRIFSV